MWKEDQNSKGYFCKNTTKFIKEILFKNENNVVTPLIPLLPRRRHPQRPLRASPLSPSGNVTFPPPATTPFPTGRNLPNPPTCRHSRSSCPTPSPHPKICNTMLSQLTLELSIEPSLPDRRRHRILLLIFHIFTERKRLLAKEFLFHWEIEN